MSFVQQLIPCAFSWFLVWKFFWMWWLPLCCRCQWLTFLGQWWGSNTQRLPMLGSLVTQTGLHILLHPRTQRTSWRKPLPKPSLQGFWINRSYPSLGHSWLEHFFFWVGGLDLDLYVFSCGLIDLQMWMNSNMHKYNLSVCFSCLSGARVPCRNVTTWGKRDIVEGGWQGQNGGSRLVCAYAGCCLFLDHVSRLTSDHTFQTLISSRNLVVQIMMQWKGWDGSVSLVHVQIILCRNLSSLVTVCMPLTLPSL